MESIIDFNISICSYNIFWQVMKNNSSPLEKQIGKSKLDKLKSNILNNILKTKKYYNPFVFCFQEAANYTDILEIFSSDKEFISHTHFSNPEHILTIWNSTILEKKYILDGEFEAGRPFSLFVFKDLRFDIHFILINIHSGHNPITSEAIFDPIQNIINLNKKNILKFDIKRIIIVGDFNRDIGSQIIVNPKKYYLNIKKKFNFYPFLKNTNKTCCSLKGYGYNKNYDQVIDSLCEPILIHQMNKESWYKPESSDHLMILSIVKNFI